MDEVQHAQAASGSSGEQHYVPPTTWLLVLGPLCTVWWVKIPLSQGSMHSLLGA